MGLQDIIGELTYKRAATAVQKETSDRFTRLGYNHFIMWHLARNYKGRKKVHSPSAFRRYFERIMN